MASISSDPNGNRTVQFVAPDGKRKSIRLGKLSLKAAEAVKLRVEALVAASAAGLAWDAETARWVGSLANALHDKLAGTGLVPPRQAAVAVHLRDFLDRYAEGRTDAKASTVTAMRTGAERLVAYFGADRDLRSITPGDADEFAIWLLWEDYAPATAGRTIKWARQFFRAAAQEADPREPVWGCEGTRHGQRSPQVLRGP